MKNAYRNTWNSVKNFMEAHLSHSHKKSNLGSCAWTAAKQHEIKLKTVINTFFLLYSFGAGGKKFINGRNNCRFSLAHICTDRLFNFNVLISFRTDAKTDNFAF